jgi:hypothetical protein
MNYGVSPSLEFTISSQFFKALLFQACNAWVRHYERMFMALASDKKIVVLNLSHRFLIYAVDW